MKGEWERDRDRQKVFLAESDLVILKTKKEL